LTAMMRGHYAYYGITGNFRRLSWYARRVATIWQKWLSRRDRRGRFPGQRRDSAEERAKARTCEPTQSTRRRVKVASAPAGQLAVRQQSRSAPDRSAERWHQSCGIPSSPPRVTVSSESPDPGTSIPWGPG
jgi:hypothetical protein